jgi:hypothetical protein
MAVYKDSRQPIELRVAAAKVAIGFEKPRLAAIDDRVEGSLSLAQLVRASMAPREQPVASSRTEQEWWVPRASRPMRHLASRNYESQAMILNYGCSATPGPNIEASDKVIVNRNRLIALAFEAG